jgi:hypothetical protein
LQIPKFGFISELVSTSSTNLKLLSVLIFKFSGHFFFANFAPSCDRRIYANCSLKYAIHKLETAQIGNFQVFARDSPIIRVGTHNGKNKERLLIVINKK